MDKNPHFHKKKQINKKKERYEMYRSRQVEVSDSWKVGGWLFALSVLVGLCAWIILFLICEILFGVSPHRYLQGMVFFGTTGLILSVLINSSAQTVPANNRLLTNNVLSPMELADHPGETDPKEYGPGFALLYPWEQEVELVSLETDISVEGTQEISAIQGDTPKMEYQFDLRPNPEKLPYYILNGKPDTEREKKIKERLNNTIRSTIESVCSNYRTPEGERLTDDNLMENISGLQTELRNTLRSTIQAELDELGVLLVRVRIGDINFSDDKNEAIRLASSTEAHTKSVEKIMGVSEDIDGPTAVAAALSLAEETKGKSFFLGMNKEVGKGGLGSLIAAAAVNQDEDDNQGASS